jgi:hypothetical protein
MKKRVLVEADKHSGHHYGLTPPDWWSPKSTKQGKFQRELWGFRQSVLKSLQPIDILIDLGDMIDGKGERSGGVELITTDRNVQADMAEECIKQVKAKEIRMCFGTPYHTGREEDIEKTVQKRFKGSEIHGHGFASVNGVVIDYKHDIGSSATPHGRHTAMARARLWNAIWNAEHERQPKADILLRGHDHYYGYCGGDSWLGINCPALTYNSSFGIRKCEGVVHVGMIVIDIDSKGGFSWQPILADFAGLRVRAEYL